MPADADPFPPLDPDRLRDRTFVVSGATGAVGSALVAKLATHGARLGIAARKAWQVDKLRKSLGGVADPRNLLVAHVGNRDAEAAAGFVKGVEDSLGAIDALVSCAGAFAYADVGEEPSGRDLELLDANFLVAHTLARAVVSPMLRRDSGALVFTGARVVGTPTTGMALYAASKAALHEYARTLAAEVGPRGIRVRVVAPGVVDTAANREAMPDADHGSWIPVDVLVDALLVQATGKPDAAGDDIVRVL